MSQQQRFILAFVLSIAILFGFTYLQRKLYPPPPENANANVAATPQNTATPAATNAPTQPQPATNTPAPVVINSSAPQRTVTIKSPLYETKLDTRGALATSWILKRNNATQHPLYSVAGPKTAQIPLELVSPEGLKRTPQEAPLALATEDANLSNALASSNYALSGADGDTIDLSAGSKRLDFTLKDSATGLDIVMSLEG